MLFLTPNGPDIHICTENSKGNLVVVGAAAVLITINKIFFPTAKSASIGVFNLMI